MKKKRIRPLAICIFRHNDRILVAEGYDSVKDEYFYRLWEGESNLVSRVSKPFAVS